MPLFDAQHLEFVSEHRPGGFFPRVPEDGDRGLLQFSHFHPDHVAGAEGDEGPTHAVAFIDSHPLTAWMAALSNMIFPVPGTA